MNPRRMFLSATVIAAGLLLPALKVLAHNNPSFREDLLLSIDIAESGEDGVYSQPFSLDWEKKTVQLIWRTEPQQANLMFAIEQDGEVVLDDVSHDQATARLKGDNYRIVNVDGAQGEFVLKVFAKVLDRSAKKKD